MAGVGDRLDELYPGEWALLLVPLAPNSKRPIDKTFLEDASVRYFERLENDNPEEFRKQHLKYMQEHLEGGGNVGMVVPSGAILLDADNEEALAKFKEKFPDCPFQQSRPGRGHFLLGVDNSLKITQRSNIEYEGIKFDVRIAFKGQFVADPSIHPEGGQYTFKNTLPRAGVSALPRITDDVLGAIRGEAASVPKSDKSKTGGFDLPDIIESGARQELLWQYACHLRGKWNWNESKLYNELSRINEERVRPGLPNSELRSIAKRASGKEGGKNGHHIRKDASYFINAIKTPKNVEVKPITWFAEGYIPKGELTSFEGRSGLMKSSVVLLMLARATKGYLPLPDDQELATGDIRAVEPQRALIFSGEDDMDRVIKVKMEKAGADPEMYGVMDGSAAHSWKINDLDILEEIYNSFVFDVLVLDPVTSFYPSSEKGEAFDVRQLLQELRELALRLDFAIVFIQHMRKDKSGGADSQALGSIEFGNICRARLQLYPNPDNPLEEFILLPHKMSYRKPRPGMILRPKDNQEELAVPEFVGYSPYSTHDLDESGKFKKGSLKDKGEEGQANRDNAAEIILQELTNAGEEGVPVERIDEILHNNGLTPRARGKIRKEIGAKSEKSGYQGGFKWRLDDDI